MQRITEIGDGLLQINLLFWFKGVDIAGNVEVELILLNLIKDGMAGEDAGGGVAEPAEEGGEVDGVFG